VGHADAADFGPPIGVVVARRDPRRRGRCARPRSGLRGFFLADPERLSLIALVDQFATDSDGPGAMYRIEGGNQRLARRHSPRRSAIGCA
jgi:hypothetical protein